MELDNVTVTPTTIEFYNVSSVGSNLTNTNATYISRADFYGLDVGLWIYNVDTDRDLFESVLGSQDYNAAFAIGRVLRITGGPSPTSAKGTCLAMVVQFGTFPILIGLLGTIIFLGAVVFLLLTAFVRTDLVQVDMSILFRGILTVVVVAILVIIAIFILSVLCVAL